MSGITTATAIMIAAGTSAAIAGGTALYTGNQQRIAATRAADQAQEGQVQQQILAQQALEQQQATDAANLAQQQSASDASVAAQTKASEASIQVQKQAIDSTNSASAAQLALQQQAMNRQNQKTPDVGAMLSANAQQAKGGQSGTMLTGPTGVDASSLSLGKNTLLGA